MEPGARHEASLATDIRIKLAAVLLFMLLLLPALFASESPRVPVRLAFAPKEGCFSQDANGQASGYGYEIMQKMLVLENWSYEYVGTDPGRTFEDGLNQLRNNEVDILVFARNTPQREQDFLYSELPIGQDALLIAVKQGNNTYSINNYQQWNGMRIGWARDEEALIQFDAYARSHGFSYTHIEFTDTALLEQALQEGTIDAMVTGNFRKIQDVWVLDQCAEEPYYILVNSQKPQLLRQVNEALAQMVEEDPNYLLDLYKAYYDPNGESAIAYTKEEIDFIQRCNQEGRVFTALINPDRNPLSYYMDGQVHGLLKDICQLVFDRSGLQVEFMITTDREQYVNQLPNADIVCDFTGSVGATEKKGFIFVDSYYNSTTSMLRRKDYDGTGNRCAIVGNAVSSWLKDNLKDVQFVSFDTVGQCIQAVVDGDADFLYSYTRCVQEWVYSDITNSLVVVADNHQKNDFSIGIRKDLDAMLSSILLKSLGTLTTNDISAIADSYTHYEKGNQSLLAMIYDQPLYFIVMVLLCAFLIFGGFILYFAIRQRKRAAVTNKQLQQALADAEVADRARMEFFSRVSHDMRTPMNGILGMAGLCAGETDPVVLQDNVKKIQESGEYLLGLINDILDFQKMEIGNVQLQPVVISTKKLISECADLIAQNAADKGVSFSIETKSADLESYILVDAVCIKKLFINLLSNAVKFTPAGGSVTIGLEVISREDHTVHDRITISDTGIGMSPEFLKDGIFKPFSQEYNEFTAHNEGTGLGLSIAKQLVNLLHATMQVESTLGVGTTFTIDIDFQVVQPDRAMDDGATKKQELQATMKQLQGIHVLLVEDQPINAMITTKLLEKAGCSVTWATDGKQAVQVFDDSQPGSIDLILMDIRMPVMNGLDAAKAIRALCREDAQTTPIIALTANAYAKDIQNSLDAGMNGHLAKPIDSLQLYRTIVGAIQHNRH